MSSATTGRLPASFGLPRVLIADGTLEVLKWLALVLMAADHVNKFLFHHSLPYVFEAARLVMPLFGCILGYNLARPGAMQRGVYKRTMQRLAFFGALASPFFLALNGWWPLNVLWMLFLVTAICYCIERNTRRMRAAAVVLFVAGGAFVEFWWFGMLFCIAAWQYCRRPSRAALLWSFVGLVSLTVVNRNWWALAVVPIILVAPFLTVHVPRVRWAFYIFYPAHLAVLLALVYR